VEIFKDKFVLGILAVVVLSLVVAFLGISVESIIKLLSAVMGFAS